MNRNSTKYALGCLNVFLLLVVAYLAFACVACLVPDKPVQEHIYQSVHQGDLQEDYPRAVLPKKQCQMDNFTDALILNQAYRCSKDSLLVSMLEVWRATDRCAYVDVLRNETEGRVESTYPYPRYWHGSTFLMRIMLLFTNYTSIRMLMFVVSMLLLLWAAYGFAKAANPLLALLMVLSLAVMNVHVMMFSIQFFPVLALALIGVVLVCRLHDDSRRLTVALFVIGSLTAYFDLLTTPLITLGIPLCCLFAIKSSIGTIGWTRQLLLGAETGFMWAVGYGATWIGKWLIAGALTRFNAVEDAVGQVAVRSSGLDDYSRLDAVMKNLDFMPWQYLIITLVVLAVMMLVRGWSGRWRSSLLLLLVSLIPIGWFLFAANHSYEHWWFTYRELMISIMALLFAVGILVATPKQKEPSASI